MSTVVFPGHLNSLSAIGDFVVQSARAAGLNDSDVYAVELAVDEACTNIIEHAYGCRGEKEITCTCETTSQGIKVILKDNGCEFNPRDFPKPQLGLPLAKMKTRGVGIFLMTRLMDKVQHVYIPGEGNVLTLFKRRSA